jgi:hypothetical protein
MVHPATFNQLSPDQQADVANRMSDRLRMPAEYLLRNFRLFNVRVIYDDFDGTCFVDLNDWEVRAYENL